MSEALLKEIARDLKKVDSTVTRLDERTIQHEKRMNRSDRHSAGLGGLTGLFAGILGAFLKSFVHPGGGA